MLITGSWADGSAAQGTPFIWISHGYLCKSYSTPRVQPILHTADCRLSSPLACGGAAPLLVFLYTASFSSPSFLSVFPQPFSAHQIFLSGGVCSGEGNTSPSLWFWRECSVSFCWAREQTAM